MNLFANQNFMNNQFMNNQFMDKWMEIPMVKEILSNQAAFADQFQKIAKTTEEMNKKTFETINEQLNLINQNSVTEKYNQAMKEMEENYKKVFSFIEDNSKNFGNKDFMAEQMKQIEKNMQVVNKSFMEQIEKNNQLFNEGVVTKMFEQYNAKVKEMFEYASKYSEDQLKFFIKFQNELMDGFKGKDAVKDVQNTIVKFSQELVDNNTKTLTEGVKSVMSVNAQAMSEGVKSVKKMVANKQ